jgi:hypothetical protein
LLQIKKLQNYRDILKRGRKTDSNAPEKIDLSHTDINKKETNKITGNRSVTINIHIDTMIKDFTVKATTIRESMNDVKEKIVSTMLSAINDSQIVAGQ